MIIAFVLDDTLDRTDGVQQYILVLGKWLSGAGHTVHYIVGNTIRRDVPNIHSLSRFVTMNFNANRVRTPLPANKRLIRQLLAQIHPDVLHVQLPCSPLLAGRVIEATPSDTAIIGTFHILPATRWHTYANTLLEITLRAGLRRMATVIAVSEPAAEFARSTYNLSAVVIPPAVDISSVRSGLVHEGSNKIVKIAFLGRLVGRKGTLQLVRAYNGLPSKVAELSQLEIGGTGPLLKQAVKLARENQRIKFVGFVNEALKPSFFADADIAVFPSTSGESFGIVLVEAMAAGSGVVIGGNNPGYASVLDLECLVDPDDTKAFSEALARLITNSDIRSRLHQQQQRAIEQYDVSKIGPAVEDVYQNAIKGRSTLVH